MCEVIEFGTINRKNVFDKKLKEFNNFKRMEFEDRELTPHEQKRYENIHKWLISRKNDWSN